MPAINLGKQIWYNTQWMFLFTNAIAVAILLDNWAMAEPYLYSKLRTRRVKGGKYN
jgi:hypothetical protein